ncbi:hypothetical protein DUI87_03881 [Hirundo rustica rustica]|uniref:Uncharacterized protein n=1 Tax=Hirundo rustica rustica TaxID=333673 RepID=A0A3M0L5S3_HIRRU|nr:hypothetical protein DUI87_03881 [Hirundo rustica rustica]
MLCLMHPRTGLALLAARALLARVQLAMDYEDVEENWAKDGDLWNPTDIEEVLKCVVNLIQVSNICSLANLFLDIAYQANVNYSSCLKRVFHLCERKYVTTKDGDDYLTGKSEAKRDDGTHLIVTEVRAAVGEAIILHYMDDVLMCAPNDDLLSHALDLTVNSLVAAVFELQEEKIQRMPPWKYLGLEIGEKSSDAMKHLIQAFSFLGIPKSIKTDNGPTYTSKEFRIFLQQWGAEHKTGIPYSPTGQAIVGRTHQNLKRILSQQHQSLKLETPQIQLSKALFTLNFLNCRFENLNPPDVCHFRENCQLQLKAKPLVMVKDPATRETEGPHDLITWRRGYTCVSTPSGPKWVPAKWVKPFIPKTAKPPAEAPQMASAAWRRRKRRTLSF